MKIKSFYLGFLIMVLIGCASVGRYEPIDIYQDSKSYKNRSFDEVWSAALRSIDQMGFVIRNATKKVGLIHAETLKNPDPRYLPPRMNVIIKQADKGIEVNFHIELPGQRDDTRKRRTYADLFFKTLRKNLRQ